MTTNKERPLAVLGSTVLATLAAVLVLALAFAPAASAATIDYGTFFGTDVEFSDVSETSSDPLPLFGPPTVSGNSLDFNPLAFSATSDGGGSEATSADLSFTVAAKSGSVIKGISLSEIGTATLAGNVPPGSMGTAAVVVTSGFLHIHEVDFVGIGDIAVPFALTFSPSGGTYFLGTDGGGGPFFSSQWTGSATLNVDAILAANGVAFEHGATNVSINLTDTLSAASETGTSAVINKNDVSVTIIRAAGPSRTVPEPGTLTLIGAGLTALMLRRRRGLLHLPFLPSLFDGRLMSTRNLGCARGGDRVGAQDEHRLA